jgi:hypothetical protein
VNDPVKFVVNVVTAPIAALGLAKVVIGGASVELLGGVVQNVVGQWSEDYEYQMDGAENYRCIRICANISRVLYRKRSIEKNWKGTFGIYI